MNSQETILTGNHAASYAALAADVEVIIAYPITPQTPVVEKLSELKQEKEDFNPMYMRMTDGEHAAMGAAIGASFTGCRVFAPTSNHGSEFQYEMLHWAADQKAPIVQTVATRGVGPWNIWRDHQGTMGMPATGWLIQFASNPQEVHDLTIMQYKVSEDPQVYLPGMIIYDGFYTSHQTRPVFIRGREAVGQFLPKPPEDGWEHIKFNPEHPMSLGVVNHPEKGIWMEKKIKINESHERARKVYAEAVDEFNQKFNTEYSALAEEHGCENADAIFVAAGSFADDLKIILEDEEDIGFIKLKSLQPFPTQTFQKYPEKDIISFDLNIDYGMNGGYIKSKINASHGKVNGIIAGLGGRSIPENEIKEKVIERWRKGKNIPSFLNADYEAARKMTMYQAVPMKNKKELMKKIRQQGARHPEGRIKILKPEEMEYSLKSWSERHKDLAFDKEWLPGGTACQGCTNLSAINMGLGAMDGYKAMVTPASCLNVIVGTWPRSSANIPFTNMAFAAGPSAASGIKTGFKYKGINAHVICWTGDGGAGIGRNALEGAITRKEDIIIVVNDNREFQNTGGQASSTTDLGAFTTTSPYGNAKNPENLAWHIASHNNLPYMATVTPFHKKDLKRKFRKAGKHAGKGTRYLHLLQPCPSGWKYGINTTKKICQSSVGSWQFPLYEVKEGKLWISEASLRYKNKQIEPRLKQYLGLQKRFSKITPQQYEKTLEECKQRREFMLNMHRKRIRPP